MHDVEGSRSASAFPIVGVGASAGGLEAFTQLLRCLPSDTGLGFVLIQHLNPAYPSLLSEALGRVTSMRVQQAEQGMLVEQDHVYVITPNTDIAIRDGRLVLSPRRDGPKAHVPVDFFLRSLAVERRSQAIGVVLSGTGSDGTDGLRAVREEDGITFAQDPHSARFGGMPQSAVDAGVVDHCLGIPELAEELVRLSHHPYEQTVEPDLQQIDPALRDAIFARVRDTVGVDFSAFKLPSAARRLARCFALRRVVDVPAYLALLAAQPDEVRSLCEDMLIHVTAFFRDPEVFTSLHTSVFPEILAQKREGSTVRVWVAGCSSGEEVYSLAIALLEFLGDAPRACSIQIFGSDVSEIAVQKARAGVYRESAMREVSDERRKRFFGKVEGGYRINKSVRDLCVFVRHDLARDPPFSRLDLVSCRNVLIYFDPALQKKVLPVLHYCLNLPGFLLLGRSESIAGLGQLFSMKDKANKVFVRTNAASSLRFAPRAELSPPSGLVEGQRSGAPSAQNPAFARHLDRLLLARYSPPGVLVNEDMDVLLFRGRTGSYLEAAPGLPQNNLISMARGGLISALRTTIAQAKEQLVAVRCPGVQVDQGGSIKICDVVVVPFSGLPVEAGGFTHERAVEGDVTAHEQNKELLFVVLFEEPARASALEADLAQTQKVYPGSSDEQRRSARLEHELAATKEYMYSLIEEHSRASDELGTSNEELISGNEELQSMNEELETAKEELQSINEELSTVNEELQSRNLEVTQANSDLLNFSLAVDIPIVTLDAELRIRRFTPRARSILNVLPSDVGRSIEDIRLNVEVPNLSAQIAQVIETTTVRETEIQDKLGRWYRMQIRPYTTAEHVVDGVILSLTDIHVLKGLVAVAEDARAQAERANGAKNDFLATLSHELRTPLSSILLNAQRLRRGDVLEPEDLRRVGDSLERATWMQVKLIDDLLDVSRIVAGKLTLDPGLQDLGSLVRASVDSVSALIHSKSLLLTVAIDPTLGPIWADRVRVQQVLLNLLNNAVKFTPHGGCIAIAVDTHGDFARLRVTDSGIGIEAGFLPHVFVRFSQRDRSITRKYGGLGLGLALVRDLVELQGGTVRAESPGVALGATFTVTFPLTSASATASAETASAASDVQAFERSGRAHRYEELRDLRVLFVDDDQRTREAVLEVLRITGARVDLAGSAADAMLAVEAFKPQVILCDIAMPGEDGYTFIRRLRAREAAGSVAIPALALSALASDEDRRRALAAGFQMHLAKPIDIDRLRDAVLGLSRLIRPVGAQHLLVPGS